MMHGSSNIKYPKPISTGTVLHTGNCPPAEIHSKPGLLIKKLDTEYYIINV